MIQTINVSDFRDAFRACGRHEQFSYEGLGALFDYLEEIDPDYELDVIALCCEFSEDTIEQIAHAYNITADDTDGLEAAARAYLEENTHIVADLNGRFLYAHNF
jgi:hypothetical protein